MAVKLVVFNGEDPCVGVVLQHTEPGTPGRAMGWYGKCTQCGRPTHHWDQGAALQAAQAHVDSHGS